MTYREKLQKEHPEKVSPEWCGGCYSCPNDYGYCSRTETLCGKTKQFRSNNKKCTKCWDQKIPGTEKKKIKRIPPDTKKEWKPTDAVFKDGHREKIFYCSGHDGHFIHFATESGVYAWNDDHISNYGTKIKQLFSKCNTYRDERGDLRTQYFDASYIDHIEFEEVEVDE